MIRSRRKLQSLAWILAVASSLGGAMVTVLAQDQNDQKAEAPADSAPAKVHTHLDHEPGCIADAAAVEDLRRARESLETQKKELAAKEAELQVREKILNEELARLDQAREDIEKLDTLRKKENEEKVAKLVEAVEGMSPKAAAQLLVNVDEVLAVATMARLSTQKLSKIMNVMEPAKSSRLAESLAGVARARKHVPASNGAAAATISANKAEVHPAHRAGNSKEGGEKNDGKSQQQQQQHAGEHDPKREPSSKR